MHSPGTGGKTAVAIFFISSLLTATFIGSKLTDVFGVTVSVGLFVFPFTFVAMEIATEVYGKTFARGLIRSGIWVQLYVLALIGIGRWLPDSEFRGVGDAFSKVFGLAPRMILASITAYTVAQLLDVTVFLRIRQATRGRHLWLRANAASYLSQAIDTAVFMVIFLGGVLPWGELLPTALAAYLVKIAVGTFDTPLVYLGAALARRLDRGASGDEPFSVVPVRTSIFKRGESLADFIHRAVAPEQIRDGMVLAVTSKIVSLAEHAVVAREGVDKRELIERESERFLGETLFGVALTIKHGILIPSAGIDESNSEDGSYILFPKDPYASARKLHGELRARWGITRLGVLITDSHTQPLRKGVTGIALSHWGFRATRNLVGEKDLYGREMKMTHVNVIDALAVAAVYEMGEVSERRPIAMLYGSGVEFVDETSIEEIRIAPEEDLYGHLLFPK